MRGNACRIGRAVSAISAAPRACGIVACAVLFKEGHERDFPAERGARAVFVGVRSDFRLRKLIGSSILLRIHSFFRRCALCVYERFSRDSRAVGCGKGDEATFPARVFCFLYFGVRRIMYSVVRTCRGRRRARCRYAVFVCHAGQTAFFRCCKLCDSHVARFRNLSAVTALRQVPR